MNRAARRRHRVLWLTLAALLLAVFATAWHTRAVRQATESRIEHASSSFDGELP